MARLIERLAIVVAALAISIGVIALLSGGLLAGHDVPGVTGATAGPGVRYADQGAAQLRPGDLEPVYDSDPPTSGPHVPTPVTLDGAPLSDYQLLQALQVGDVVFVYGTRRPPAGLARLAAEIAPFTPALAATGGSVVLASRPGISGIVALAWTRMLRVADAGDPQLRSFAQYWLGRGYSAAR
ncbi:MAG: DUF3105 domain-containing protein [Solirubrobacteraceae bacterium]